MQSVSHAMIDGALLRMSAAGDLGLPPDCFGRVRVPALNQAHRFEVHRAGFSYQMERQPPPLPNGTILGPVSEFSLRGGTLRTIQVDAPHPHGWMRHLTIGSWEGTNGCIWTSKDNSTVDEMVAIYESVEFVDSTNGVYFTSPIEPDFRGPSCLKEIRGDVLLEIWPLTPARINNLPAGDGTPVPGGALYRVSQESSALLLVTDSVQVAIEPLDEKLSEAQYMAIVDSLRVDWSVS